MTKKSFAGSVSFTVLAACRMFVDSDTHTCKHGPTLLTSRGMETRDVAPGREMACCIFSRVGGCRGEVGR